MLCIFSFIAIVSLPILAIIMSIVRCIKDNMFSYTELALIILSMSISDIILWKIFATDIIKLRTKYLQGKVNVLKEKIDNIEK